MTFLDKMNVRDLNFLVYNYLSPIELLQLQLVPKSPLDLKFDIMNKLRNDFKQEFPFLTSSFFKKLQECNGVISGGSLLQILLSERWHYLNPGHLYFHSEMEMEMEIKHSFEMMQKLKIDLDLYLPQQSVNEFMRWCLDNNFTESKDNQTNHIRYYENLQKVPYVLQYIDNIDIDTTNLYTIEIFIIPNTDINGWIKNNFDFDLVMNTFDGNKLSIVNGNGILKKTGFMRTKNVEHNNHWLTDRVLKYTFRGFDINIVNFPIGSEWKEMSIFPGPERGGGLVQFSPETYQNISEFVSGSVKNREIKSHVFECIKLIKSLNLM